MNLWWSVGPTCTLSTTDQWPTFLKISNGRLSESGRPIHVWFWLGAFWGRAAPLERRIMREELRSALLYWIVQNVTHLLLCCWKWNDPLTCDRYNGMSRPIAMLCDTPFRPRVHCKVLRLRNISASSRCRGSVAASKQDKMRRDSFSRVFVAASSSAFHRRLGGNSTRQGHWWCSLGQGIGEWLVNQGRAGGDKVNTRVEQWRRHSRVYAQHGKTETYVLIVFRPLRARTRTRG